MIEKLAASGSARLDALIVATARKHITYKELTA